MKAIRLAFLLLLAPSFLLAQANSAKREYYQLTTYHFVNGEQEQTIDGYLKSAYIPALHKKGIKNIGVFKPVTNDTAAVKKIFMLVPLKTADQITTVSDELLKDKTYLQAAKDYLQTSNSHPAYQRMEVSLLYAFELAPAMQLPDLKSARADRIYELRSYESASENLYRNKVKMFNEGGEIALFKRLGFNAVFYAETVAGAHMPNLVYMTSFENMEERNKHWKSFGEDAEWKKLSSLQEYKGNVSHIDVYLTKATDYSDL